VVDRRSGGIDEDQVRVEQFPSTIEAGFAESDTAGAGGGGGIATGGGGGGAGGAGMAFLGQRAFACAVASFALAIPSWVRHDK
jgi:hypothetical protein